MNQENENNEPSHITRWRRSYKINYGDLDYHKENSSTWDCKKFEEEMDWAVSKGNINNEIAQFLKLSRRNGRKIDESINKVPIFESPSDYPVLKDLSEKIEAAIQRKKTRDDKDSETKFILNQSPYIITGKRTKLYAESGRTPNQDPDSNDINYYIGYNTLFVYYIRRISVISYDLYSITNDGDIKKLMWYFRDVFFHFTLLGNEELNDKNINKLIKEEREINSTGSLDLITKISNVPTDPINLIRESMGLFITGHEYAHLILKHNMNDNKNRYQNEIEDSYRKEFQADKLAIELIWDCMQNEYSQKPEWKNNMIWLFVGIEIILNCLNVIDNMHGVLNGNSKAIVTKTHPPIKTRMKCIREEINNLWEKYDISPQKGDILDAFDDIFKKMEDYFVNELSKNKHIIKYRRNKKLKIKKLLNSAEKIYKSRQKKYDETGKLNIDTDNEIKKIYENILKEDNNNTTALFRLGVIYFENNMYNESLINFSLLSYIIFDHDDINNSSDRILFFKSNYYIGLIYLRKIETILCDNVGKLSQEQQKEKGYYINNAIEKLEIASNGYNNNGIIYYHLGTAYSIKNDHKKAIEKYNKALEYQPDNNQIFLALNDSISKLAEFKGAVSK